MSPWSQCSGKCGLAERHRRIWCSHNERELEDNYCLQIEGGKPPVTDKCHRDLYCPSWATGMWSEVSSSRVDAPAFAVSASVRDRCAHRECSTDK